MDTFGVRFSFADPRRFDALRSLDAEIRRDKEAGHFLDVAAWISLVPDDIKSNFRWPTETERRHWQAIRHATIISFPEPSQQLGEQWYFDRVFETIEEGEYDVMECAQIAENIGELRINPHAYPYGGVGPFIALTEAFGFRVLGVNEYGKYESREELGG